MWVRGLSAPMHLGLKETGPLSLNHLLWEPGLLTKALSYHVLSIKIQIYRTVILFVVLYGYETWSITFREERRLIVFENVVLMGIFGA
jgi:hypothetical protein